MIDAPKTLEEAKEKKYGKRWNKGGFPYQEGKCAEEVSDHDSRSPSYTQCTRANGHGPSGLYCKQHARKYGVVDGDVVKDVWVMRSGVVYRVNVTIMGKRAKVNGKAERIIGPDSYLWETTIDAWFPTLGSALIACVSYHAGERDSHKNKAEEHERARALALEMMNKQSD